MQLLQNSNEQQQKYKDFKVLTDFKLRETETHTETEGEETSAMSNQLHARHKYVERESTECNSRNGHKFERLLLCVNPEPSRDQVTNRLQFCKESIAVKPAKFEVEFVVELNNLEIS
jgi:hypothetical protein